jgi:CCR4-NOT transcription complex subunit 3
VGGNLSGQGGNMLSSGQVTPNANAPTVASPSNASSTLSVAAASARPGGRVGVTGASSTPASTSSSSSSSTSSSQKQDSFVAALSRASRSASLTLPEPVLPNPWISQTMAQLRFSASILSASLQHLPEGVDERPKVHTVRQLNPTPHPSFPASPDYRLLDSPASYERLSQDTLFFIFYHCQGGFQQYLAGRELKNRNSGWRFHKPHRTWFKTTSTEDPHDPPETSTNSTLYFDFDQEWAMINTTLVPPSNEFEHDE